MKLVAVLLVLCSPIVAHAQTCLGRAPISRAQPGSAGVAIGFATDVIQVGGFIGGGNDAAFGLVAVGLADRRDLDVRVASVGGTFGGQVAANPDRRVMICPMGSVGYTFMTPVAQLFAPDGKGYAIDSNGGASVGIAAYRSDTVSIVPTLGFGVNYRYVKLGDDTEDASTTLTFGTFQVGVGLVMGRSSLTPMFAKAFGGDASDAPWGFQLTYAYAFGGSK